MVATLKRGEKEKVFLWSERGRRGKFGEAKKILLIEQAKSIGKLFCLRGSYDS